MRFGASLPPGAAMLLIGSCLFLLLLECGAEVGGRHIRRITAADLPSSNSTVATRTKLKKLQSLNEPNCTQAGTCSSSTTPPVSPEETTKSVSSFVADDVLQRRLHLTTNPPPHAENLERLFENPSIPFDDYFENKTNYFPREVSSFRDYNHSATEASNFDAPLTTPRIGLFDDFHDRLTEGIQQNLDSNEHSFRNTHQKQSVNIPSYERANDPKKNESIALEFTKKLSLVYNDSSSPISVSRNVVIENGTRVNLEKSSVHTEVEPELNKTVVYYFTNESYSPELPETEPTTTEDSVHNNNANIQTVSNVTLSKPNSVEKTRYNQRGSTNRNAKNVIIKNTGTPGDKESTTSEPIRGRSNNRSQEQISNNINDNLSESTIVSNNNSVVYTLTDINTNSSGVADNINNSSKITKDLKSNKVVVYPGKTVSNSSYYRNSKMLPLGRNSNSINSTNNFDESSENPQLSSSENSLTRDQVKKSKLRNGLRRSGLNRTEEVGSSNVTLNTAELGNGSVLTQKPVEATIPSEDLTTTTEYEESTTTDYSASSRSRAFTFRRIYSGTSTNEPVSDETYETSTRESSNIDSVRKRLSTMRRRLQTSTEPSYTVVSSSNFTTESNTIVRGWPGVPRRPTVPKLSPNGTVTDSAYNNEGNEIITARTNTYKPINRNRGTVRYGSPRNTTFGSNQNESEFSFPLPPSATAWTLVTLKGTRNESKTTREPIQNNTSAANITTRVVATSVRWSPIRGRYPLTTLKPPAVSSETNTSVPSLSTSRTTKLSPVTNGNLSSRSSSTVIQQSSMQENRLSQVHVTAPTTEQSDDMTQDTLSSTTTASDNEFSTTTMLSESTQVNSEDTTLESGSTFQPSMLNIASDSLLTTEPQDEITTTGASTTTDVIDNTTFNPETTFSGTEGTSSRVTSTEMSTVYGSTNISPIYSDDQVTTTVNRYQELPKIFPTTTDTPQIVPYEEENEHQQTETDAGNNPGYHDMNNSGEEIKVGNNPGSGQLEEKNKQSGSEENRPDGVSVDNQGDLPPSNGDDVEENKSQGEKFPSGGDEHEETADENTQENSHVEPKAEVMTARGILETTAVNSATEEMETRTTTSPGTEPTATASWSSSSISAVDWDTSYNEEYNSVYLRLHIQATWDDFCSGLEDFKREVVDVMSNNNSPITKDQIVLDSDHCKEKYVRSARSTDIEVLMYLVDSDRKFDLKLTKHFYNLWTQGKLSEMDSFKINGINVIQPPQPKSGGGSTQGGMTGVQTSTADSSSEGLGPGMIAAITISCIGAVCLLLIAVLWIVMRKRQQRFNYGQRCTPVSLDAYSLDSVSVCGSVRRKGVIRSSKRSYGNAGFDDPAIPSHPMGFAGLANFISNRKTIEEEFANIPNATANVDEIPEGADTKNRYANVIPLPETRVQLNPIEGEPLSEYINANFVHGPKGANKYYIACQAPLNATVTDFWRMIWEQQSKVILMLTDLVENGVEKCADYLPPSEVLDCHRLFGDFQITLKKREVKEKYIISTLQLKNLETNSWREVMHLWYVSWPTQGVPEDPSSVIAFLLEARPYMRGGPCVVHCSPGTGRTGTVIASDLCIRDFETTRIVDIPRCVAQLRRDRAGSVQTRDQYFFIYQVINFYGAKLTGSALDSM